MSVPVKSSPKKILFLFMAALPLWAPACTGEEETDPLCEELCKTLTLDCAYQAYPTADSCMQGCTWEKDQGADIQAELDCVEQAACDTFKVIECSHLYGSDAATP